MSQSAPSELDNKLRELALTDWQKFVQLVGKDTIDKAKVCLLRQNNKSYGMVSRMVGLSIMQVRTACKRCGD